MKDISLTVTGLGLIIFYVASGSTRNLILYAGLALTGIGARFHIGKLVSGSVEPRPPVSSSPPPDGSSPHSAAGVTGD